MEEEMNQNLFNEELLSFIVLPGSNPPEEYLEYYNLAYTCWLNVWTHAYKELGINKEVFSDDFTRQTELNCIFYDKTCVGILFLKSIDLSCPTSKNDSYFKLWEKEDFEKLGKYGNNILVCSNTTVNPEWRKKVGSNISMKDLIVYFSCRRFFYSNANAMTAVTRKTRGIHKLTERFGAVTIKSDVQNFNKDDLVDLCAFYKNSVTEGTDFNVIRVGRKLWGNMVVVSSSSLTHLNEQKRSLRAA